MKTVGVIGLGSIGSRHYKNLVDMGYKVIGHDPVPPKFDYVHNDVEEIIKHCDAIIVASPSDDHAFQILCSGTKKPMLVEKPIGISKTDAIEIKAVLKNTKQTIMVGYNLRFHPCVKKAKEWLEYIGIPLWANFTLAQRSIKPPYIRDGVILNWSHEIDLALYLLGDAEVIASSTRISRSHLDYDNPESTMHDDMTDILLLHKNGCRSTVHLDYLTRSEIRQSLIVGSEATIIFDLVNHNAWFRDKDGIVRESLEANADDEDDFWNHTYIDEVKAFIDRCDGKETLGATGEEGLKVLDICLKVREQAGLK